MLSVDEICKGMYIGLAIYILSLIVKKENKIVSIKIKDREFKNDKFIQFIDCNGYDYNGYGYYVDLETGNIL